MEQPIPETPIFRIQQSPSFGNLLTENTERENLKRNNSESDMVGAASKMTIVWKCTLCSYENVDPTKSTCALCETKKESPSRNPRRHHPQPPADEQITNISTCTPPRSSLRSQRSPVEDSIQSLDLPILDVNDYTHPPAAAKQNDDDENENAVLNGVAAADSEKPILVKVSSGSGSSESENGDVVAPLPLSKLKGTAETLSLRLLDLSKVKSDHSKPLPSEHSHLHSQPSDHSTLSSGDSQDPLMDDSLLVLDESYDTLPTTNVRPGGLVPTANLAPSESMVSVSTVPTSNTRPKAPASWSSEATIPIANLGPKPSGVFRDDHSFNNSPVAITEEDFSLSQLFATQMVPGNQAVAAASPKSKPAETGFAFAPNDESPSSELPTIILEAPPPELDPPESASEPHHPWEMPLINAVSGEANDIENPKDPKDASIRRDNSLSTDETTVSWKTRIFRFLFICLVIVVLVLTILIAGGNNGDGGTSTGVGTLVTPAPTPSTDFTSEPTPVDGVPTTAPTTSPPYEYTTQPTAPPTKSLTTDFESTTRLNGQITRSRFGSSVKLNSNGDLLAVFSTSGEIQIFEQQLENATWQLHSNITVDPSSSFSFASPDGIPVLAVASTTSFRVLQYSSGEWTQRGQESLEWVADDSTVKSRVSLSAISISFDGLVLAAGSMGTRRDDSIVVRKFVLNEALQLWEPHGVPIVRPGIEGTMSLVLSGDGNVVALEEYILPSAIVEVFEWIGKWIEKGPAFEFTWGPAAVALSENGQRLGITTWGIGSGKASVYQWGESNEWVKTGKDLPGGSSIALTRGGMRVMIGKPDWSHVWIHDYQNDGWVTSNPPVGGDTSNPPLSGERGSRFGESVSMSADGNTLAVGSPLDDYSNVTDSGSVFIYL